MIRSKHLLTVGLILGAAIVAGATWSGDGEQADPFVGRTRAELIDLLGEPDKVRGKNGRETLVYKLVRLADDGQTVPGLIAFDLPGVGRVGRALAAITGKSGEVEIVPTEIDRRGVTTGGSVESSTTYSKTIELNKKERERRQELVPEERPGSRGRVKLHLELDAAGQVLAWRTTPRREAAPGR